MSTPLVLGSGSVAFSYIGTQSALAADVSEGHTFSTTKSCAVIERAGFDATAIKKCPGMIDGQMAMSLFSLGHNVDTVAEKGLALGFSTSVGGLCYFGVIPAADASYTVQMNANVEESVSGPTDGYACRGELMHYAIATPETTAGNGTGNQMVAVTATQHAILQVIMTAFTGTDITFQVERDATDAWVGSETDVFPSPLTMTAAGHQQLDYFAAAADTDTWYRLAWTGTFSSATFLAMFAIEP